MTSEQEFQPQGMVSQGMVSQGMVSQGMVLGLLGDERVSSALQTAIRFVPDAVKMVYAAIRDPRVPRRAKLEAAACLGLLAVPLEAIPLVGELELAAVLTLAMGRLVSGAGEDLLREHWDGSEAGFKAFLLLANVGFRPRKALRHFALSRVASASRK